MPLPSPRISFKILLITATSICTAFFFKQKTAYEIGLGIPAEPLFRSDVISSFGGKTSYDADNRPLLVMRSNLWASGYDVDGTDQTSLGQFSGRVQQTYKHSVPRFFVPEHGTM